MVNAAQQLHHLSLPESTYARILKESNEAKKDFNYSDALFFAFGRKIGHYCAQVAQCFNQLGWANYSEDKRKTWIMRRERAEAKLLKDQNKMQARQTTDSVLLRWLNFHSLNIGSDQFIYDFIEFLTKNKVISMDWEKIDTKYDKNLSISDSSKIRILIKNYKRTERGIRFLFSQVNWDDSSLYNKNKVWLLIDHALQYWYSYNDLPMLTWINELDLEHKLQELLSAPNTISATDLVGL